MVYIVAIAGSSSPGGNVEALDPNDSNLPKVPELTVDASRASKHRDSAPNLRHCESLQC